MTNVIRRSMWRIGRGMYSRARGEPIDDNILTNGEVYIQRCVIEANRTVDQLCIVDIGANLGDWTIPLLAALPPVRRKKGAVQIHAFEPVPTTSHAFAKRLSGAEGGDLVTLHAMAASETTGVSSMELVSETGGTNSLTSGIHGSAHVIQVKTMSMQDFVDQEELERVHLMKIDAEGHDPAIIRGARRLLEQQRIDVVQFEYNHAWVFSRSFLRDIFEIVNGLPYTVARVMPDSIELYDVWHPEMERFFHANYLLVRAPAQAWFKHLRGSFDVSNTYA